MYDAEGTVASSQQRIAYNSRVGDLIIILWFTHTTATTESCHHVIITIYAAAQQQLLSSITFELLVYIYISFAICSINGEKPAADLLFYMILGLLLLQYYLDL